MRTDSIAIQLLRIEYKVVTFECTYASLLEMELNKLGQLGFKIVTSSFIEDGGGLLNFRAVLQREVIE